MKNIVITIVLAFGSMIISLLPGRALAQASKTDAAAQHESPFVCDRLALTPDIRKRHFDDLEPKIRALKTGVRELPDGYEFSFPADQTTFALVAEWVIQERLCCPFFDIDLRLEREGGPLWMRLTGRPGTKDFMKVDGKAWLKQ
ncbi:MAG TPA: hypothetical protein VKZ53_25865 [Candidatus Angelobacter sp.]|nr:hypothetical protein [Candidatus Angelobacter sp.]